MQVHWQLWQLIDSLRLAAAAESKGCRLGSQNQLPAMQHAIAAASEAMAVTAQVLPVRAPGHTSLPVPDDVDCCQVQGTKVVGQCYVGHETEAAICNDRDSGHFGGSSKGC